jgi:cysteinyl-tRNA synthetase
LVDLKKKSLEGQEEGTRIKKNPEKKNYRDFALWKFSNKPGFRQQEWKSPWGVGYPGWHIECSAMSKKYLGQPFDIHTGGVDHLGTHHTNEIAQSEAANGVELARYFMHAEHLLVEGKKMSKSAGTFVTLGDVARKGFSPLDLRFLFLQTHYRKRLNFTWKSLEAAKEGYDKLKNFIISSKEDSGSGSDELKNSFGKAINDDLNISLAISVLFEAIKRKEAKKLILNFDQVLGLSLGSLEKEKIPGEIDQLVKEREKARDKKNFKKADNLRIEIEKKGYSVKDTEKGSKILKK